MPLFRRLLRLPFVRLSASVLVFLAPHAAHASQTLVVSAAASLTQAFNAVGTVFEKQHPGTQVLLNYGASDVLMQQIAHGAPVDVFASADQKAMDRAVAENVVVSATRADFAANSLVLIVPSDSRFAPASLAALNAPSIKRVAYGDPASVPAGRYTQGALMAAGVWPAVSAKGVLAANVRQSLDYVARGEVDAGFVFGTDAALMPQRVKVVLTVATPTPITYPLAQVAGSRQPALAQAFIAFVRSPAGQALLSQYGFKPAVSVNSVNSANSAASVTATTPPPATTITR
ncbi:molybdate ABC transporter substrate-binding protein [Paraburkholderia bonniea]|uniref:molybdate ABC transporter substrate-binding protein n=1 Tax=Paraburkholderia bonniea TaxID=2152891 RepID=UPI001292B6D3|nr:molybdate ABC transporter substrate-binding protein [Paraburkholderia bonniea]